jgi:hypothetical protein
MDWCKGPLPFGVRIPNLPVRDKSLYRLHCPSFLFMLDDILINSLVSKEVYPLRFKAVNKKIIIKNID